MRQLVLELLSPFFNFSPIHHCRGQPARPHRSGHQVQHTLLPSDPILRGWIVQVFHVTMPSGTVRGTVTIQDRQATERLPPFHVKDHEARTLLLSTQTVNALVFGQKCVPEGVPYVLITADRWQRVRQNWSLCRAGKPWKLNKSSGQLDWAAWENRYMVHNVIRDVRSHVRRAGIPLTSPLTVNALHKAFGQNHADAGRRNTSSSGGGNWHM